MPKRPRNHELEDLSKVQLRNVFSQVGWVVWELHPDYGEDFFVRIFSRKSSTQYSFFVQAKSTDHIEDYLHKDGLHIKYPIKADHVEYWEDFWEPVILTIWDSKSNTTYWEIVQDFLQDNNIQYTRKNINILVPLKNILNNEGLKEISQRTKRGSIGFIFFRRVLSLL